MSHPLFFLCPNCSGEESISGSTCVCCSTSITIGKDFIAWDNQQLDIARYYQFLLEKLAVSAANSPLSENNSRLPHPEADQVLRISKNAVLRQGKVRLHFKGYHGFFARFIEKPVKLDSGRLIFLEDRVEFIGSGRKFIWKAEAFTCVTTNGHYFEFKLKRQLFFQIHFLQESALKYEIIFRKWLDKYYGKEQIVEYQPKLRVNTSQKSPVRWNIPISPKVEKPFSLENVMIGDISNLLKWLMRFIISLGITGKENWHRDNRGFVLVNHQSALDPFIIGAYWDRRIAFLTKSTSFAHWFPRIFLRWVMGLPTTRYQTDPTIIPAIKSLLKQGIKIGIFPEGERCWDGRMQAFKLSVIKLLMASRETIYIIVLKNAFRFWPRWSKLPHRAKIKMVIHPPFCLIPDLYPVDEQRRFLENIFRTELGEN
jgi:1-acyl-sn-glycerol-3-phosphate acyltransferase